MKTFLSLTIGLLFLIGSAAALAGTGSTIRCTNETLNLAVVNKDLPDDCTCGNTGTCKDSKNFHKYCIGQLNYGPSRGHCIDESDLVILPGENSSVSFDAESKATAEMAWSVYEARTGGKRTLVFHDGDSDATMKAQCNEVFNGDATCTFTHKIVNGHKLDTLTISKK